MPRLQFQSQADIVLDGELTTVGVEVQAKVMFGVVEHLEAFYDKAEVDLSPTDYSTLSDLALEKAHSGDYN